MVPRGGLRSLAKRVSQLFVLALQARKTGFVATIELEKLAFESLAQAEDMERRASAGGTAAGRPTATAASVPSRQKMTQLGHSQRIATLQ